MWKRDQVVLVEFVKADYGMSKLFDVDAARESDVLACIAFGLQISDSIAGQKAMEQETYSDSFLVVP